MANKKLIYLSAVLSLIESLQTTVDMSICDADDGENYSMEEGKEAAIAEIDHAVGQLNNLKNEVTTSKYRKFCASNGLTE
jgi:hypothetical protein